MLVEDNELMRELLTYVVEQQSGLVLVGAARDGPAAVDLGMRTRPDVVVMDVDIPGVDGIETTRVLCREVPGVRVVILSASCTHHLVHLALAAGACGYLVKDGSHSLLVEGIRTAADGGAPLAPLARKLLGR